MEILLETSEILIILKIRIADILVKVFSLGSTLKNSDSYQYKTKYIETFLK